MDLSNFLRGGAVACDTCVVFNVIILQVFLLLVFLPLLLSVTSYF